MSRIYLVRHGKASGTWGEERDPGLDQTGKAQARAATKALTSMGPGSIISSPLLRARETSEPLAEIWDIEPRIESRVGEIIFPTEDLKKRMEWLRVVMKREWAKMDQELHAWRRDVVEALRELKEETVVFSHSIAINVAVGEATGNNRVMCFWPENGSITILELMGDRLTLVAQGVETSDKKLSGLLLGYKREGSG